MRLHRGKHKLFTNSFLSFLSCFCPPQHRKKQPYWHGCFLCLCLLDALDADELLEQLNGTVNAEQARINAEVVALCVAPILGGIIVVVRRAGLIRLLDAVLCLVFGDAVSGGNALDAVLDRGGDENIDDVITILQRLVRAAADEHARAFVRKLFDRIVGRKVHLLLNGALGRHMVH